MLLTDAAATLPASCRCHCRRRHAATKLPDAVLQLMTPLCHRAAKLTAALPTALLPLMMPPCQASRRRHFAVALPITLLPLMTTCCCRAAKLAAAAALPLRFPLRCCR